MVAQALPAPGWLAPGTRVYAVGDVHGCAGRLDRLHGLIAADLASRPAPRPVLIHLGDYIDRGPDSAGVVSRLAAAAAMPGPLQRVCLCGNHEQMMLRAVTGDRDALRDWLVNGAAATLASWGINARNPPFDWARAVPPRDLEFLQNLKLSFRLDGYVFVHAGVRPTIPLAAQEPVDMLWIREEFLDWPGPYLPEPDSAAIVHGHTPVRVPSVLAHRINVDTGAVKGGTLTCAVLEGRTVRFLTA